MVLELLKTKASKLLEKEEKKELRLIMLSKKEHKEMVYEIDQLSRRIGDLWKYIESIEKNPDYKKMLLSKLRHMNQSLNVLYKNLEEEEKYLDLLWKEERRELKILKK
jgi:hypothetical protein